MGAGVRVRVLGIVVVTAVAVLSGCAPTGGQDAGPGPSQSQGPTPSSPSTTSSPSSASSGTAAAARFAELEAQYGATLGVYALDTGSGEVVEYSADERFGFASTIKGLAVAAMLDAIPAEGRDRLLPVSAADIVSYSPVLEQHVGGEVSILEAADAATRASDNTAANLLFGVLGGPGALQQRLREAGDETTMVDRLEPGLNEYVPGDDRDTSTARALATSLAAFALGDELSEADRALLVEMLKNNTAGAATIRASLPDGWTIADSTGAAQYGIRNDLAVVWPSDGRAPIVMAVLSKRPQLDDDWSDAVVAGAAAVVFATLASRG